MIFTFGMNALAAVNSKWTSGDLIFFDAATDILSIRDDTDGVKIFDDLNLTFGTDNDATIKYDETTDDKLELTCSNGFTLTGALGITGDILMATTSKIQFHDTGLYINASGNGAMVISSDGTLAVGATTSYTLTSPAVKFIATTSVVHEYDAASYVTQTVDNAGAVIVTVTGDSAGSYEIATDDSSITLDSASTILLESTTGITATGDISASNAAGPQFVDEAATTTNPTLCPDKAEDDTGIGWASDTLHVVLGSADEYSFSTSTFDMNANTLTEAGKITANDAAGPAFIDEAATITNPTLCPNRADETTGIGWNTAEIHLVISGGDEYDFTATEVDFNSNNFTEVGTYSGTGAITLSPGAAGTFLDFALETEWVSGTLINADFASAEIAIALKAEKLIFLTNVKGIMKNHIDEKSLISTITEREIEDMITCGSVSSGMIPKARASIKALFGRVEKVHIIGGKIKHSLLIEVLTEEGIGTEIVH